MICIVTFLTGKKSTVIRLKKKIMQKIKQFYDVDARMTALMIAHF